jgi:uncharacterized membrane protein
MPRRAGRALLCLSLVISTTCFSGSAFADLKLCNTTTSRVGVAIGYKDTKGWATEGWWNIAAHTCETLLKGALIARYYYLHAIDYDRGGEWAGDLYMCTEDKAFTIRNVGNCVQRGYKRTGFFEVDTGEERDWTVRLTDPGAEGANAPAPANAPAGQTPPAQAPAGQTPPASNAQAPDTE